MWSGLKWEHAEFVTHRNMIHVCHIMAHSDHFNAWQGKMKTITQLLHIMNCIYSLQLVISRCSFTARTTDREEEEEEEHCVSLPHKRECLKNCLLYVFLSPSVDSTCWPHCALVVTIADSLWYREPVKRQAIAKKEQKYCERAHTSISNKKKMIWKHTRTFGN